MTTLRRLAAALAVVALLSPTAAVCLQGAGQSCEQAASSHDCCEGPRLSSCPCGGDLSEVTAEPAQRHTDPVRDLGAVSLAAGVWEPVEAPRVVSAAHDTSPPPRPGGDRLSLLSLLLV